jgi:hypothetical protein
MAELALGIGMSHSSMIATSDPEIWLAHGSIDRTHPYLRDRLGHATTFAELEAAQGHPYTAEATVEHLADQVAEAAEGVAALRAAVETAGVDVLVVLGDDQMELHDLDNMPALAVYYGEDFVMGTSLRFASYEAELGGDVSTMQREYAMDQPHVFPGHAPLASHLIDALMTDGFDVGAMNGVAPQPGRGVGHAFGIMERKLMQSPGALPLVPVFVNTYWPPNQLPISRCYDLGLALRRAIDSFDDKLRVAVVASGGLSHFSTDEVLDRQVLDACRSGDEEALRKLPPELLNGGNSEIRNWVAVAACCRDLRLDVETYIPVYRTAVGTGVGLAFATWTRR